jgi:hypothetical protein
MRVDVYAPSRLAMYMHHQDLASLMNTRSPASPSRILQESHDLSQATAPELLLMIIFENEEFKRERRRCSVTSTRSLTTSVVSEKVDGQKDVRSKMVEM